MTFFQKFPNTYFKAVTKLWKELTYLDFSFYIQTFSALNRSQELLVPHFLFISILICLIRHYRFLCDPVNGQSHKLDINSCCTDLFYIIFFYLLTFNGIFLLFCRDFKKVCFFPLCTALHIRVFVPSAYSPYPYTFRWLLDVVKRLDI